MPPKPLCIADWINLTRFHFDVRGYSRLGNKAWWIPLEPEAAPEVVAVEIAFEPEAALAVVAVLEVVFEAERCSQQVYSPMV